MTLQNPTAIGSERWGNARTLNPDSCQGLGRQVVPALTAVCTSACTAFFLGEGGNASALAQLGRAWPRADSLCGSEERKS